MEQVILVDEHDRAIGSAEKLKAHRDGQLHRAFSVFVFNQVGHLLLQRRARGKYHSGGRWSNACCGHPSPGESLVAAAERRLQEEMGFRCPLREVGRFVYRAELDHELTEHELDHVLVGSFDGVPLPDPTEVEAWRWANAQGVRAELVRAPDQFTAWFGEALHMARWT